MFQPWRLKVREAEEAFKTGRLEDATRLICDGDLQQYRPGKQLLARLAAGWIERGVAHASRGESAAGWRDLLTAEQLGAEAEQASDLRLRLIENALAEAERCLSTGNTEGCLAVLTGLERRKSGTREAQELKQIAERWNEARVLVRQGKFAPAEESLAAAARLRPELKALSEALDTCKTQQAEARHLSEHLHKAVSDKSWNDVLSLAERWLEIAPDCRTAADARRRAWSAVGMSLAATMVPAKANGAAVQNRRAGGVSPPSPPPFNDAAAAVITQHSAKQPAPAPSSAGPRFLLWVDGVGGYLVCEADEVVLGQPDASGTVDVPILGDVSRQHARIARRGEGYLITALRPTKVDGRPLDGVRSLCDGQIIELGEGVRLRFRRPHPLSGTARLEFISHHRTQPAADAVLLLSDSCILGPAANHHVVCPKWSRQVVLFKQGGGLACRTNGPLDIDGDRCQDRGPLSPNSHVAGEDFSFCLEPL